MAELTTPAETTASSCCAPEAQATCCEPSDKAECCNPSHGEGCGCAAGTYMTHEMLTLARENARKAGVESVEFHKGYVEEIPLPDASVGVVIISNVRKPIEQSA